MPEPFKTWFNAGLIDAMADHLGRIDGFDRTAFDSTALTGLDDLELMQRADQIARAMTASLPLDFPGLLTRLAGILGPAGTGEGDSQPTDARGLGGWALVPVGKFVATHGLDHPAESLAFLREMTKRFSAELAVRPFFRDHPGLTLAQAAEWARDENLHVRRLASEGSRPRLPWGLRLQRFIDDPAPLLPILETLRDDASDYVRRSVANNLNDIAKDHPDLVANIAADWQRDAPEPRRKLIRHACRSLIKAGHPATLGLFGYGAPKGMKARLAVDPVTIALGDTLTLTATLSQSGARAQPVLVDLVMRFLRADGSYGDKVFKWTETTLPPVRPQTLKKRLPLRDVTTRRHYPGPQHAALQVNGKILAKAVFDLKLP